MLLRNICPCFDTFFFVTLTLNFNNKLGNKGGIGHVIWTPLEDRNSTEQTIPF